MNKKLAKILLARVRNYLYTQITDTRILFDADGMIAQLDELIDSV